MFIQTIQGPVRDRDGIQRLLQRWTKDLAAGATGWLGSTAGVTDGGEGFIAVRFESADAARRNSARPEQGAWWDEFAEMFDVEPTFHDCDQVEVLLDGGTDDAGFVQVIQSRITDDEAWQDGLRRNLGLTRQDFDRPELIGGVVARDGDHVSEIVYFTDEAAARRGERQTPSEAVQAASEAWLGSVADVSYLDLHTPWMASA